ncbi:hypothetical protein C9F11_37915 [Streptomyces sp. YIM 121038]|uniref:hypothetical protein n=1 Tax=Streptomyces sp. YIM 121038 TaxID=2136401 RepID=UPI0011105DF2|nr:hypothetical protein [Streptomyces sp. YIM 121038]QCX81166.1 hypothetical protein C9F11_37915 [Streptomyces sp. YIM 121038]
MATEIEPRRLEDLEEDALVQVEREWQRRARGRKPWTNCEYVDQIERVHARYTARRAWLAKHGQGVGS